MGSGHDEFDIVVIGGGLVGSCVGYGLSKTSASLALLDEGDRAFRAARGNFGLVWVQGKGWDYPPYAEWTRASSDRWPNFSDELEAETGLRLGYRRPGGLEFCLTDGEVEELAEELAHIHQETDGKFQYEMLDAAALSKMVPGVSDAVRGASYCPHDGDVNPLFLLRALHQCLDQNGARYMPNCHVDEVRRREDGGFDIFLGVRQLRCARVVLCAGLDNQRLACQIGINLPIRADRGQLLVTERVQSFLPYPTLHVRQTDNGGLQIGDSAEDAGLDDNTSPAVMQMLAGRAGRIFPGLRDLQIVRAWAALRIKTPDGKPVYQESPGCPGAFAVSCHSGVTLAAIHASEVAGWIAGGPPCSLLPAFNTARFDV